MTEAQSGHILARLFVSGDSAHSVIALTHLRSAITHLAGTDVPGVEVIDVQRDALRALYEKVFITPTLRIVVDAHNPGSPGLSMAGDLSDAEQVSAFLTTATQQIAKQSPGE